MKLEYLGEGSPDRPLLRLYDFRDFSLNTTDLGLCVVDCCPDGARQTSLGRRPRKGEGVIRLLIEP